MNIPYSNASTDTHGAVAAETGSPAEARERSGVEADSADTPLTVIRGESLYRQQPTNQEQGQGEGTDGLSNAAITDWLNCSFPLKDSPETIKAFFGEFIGVTSEAFGPVSEIGKGFHGWSRSYKLGESSGVFAIGGQRGTAFLSLPGSACTLIAEDVWPLVVILLRDHYNANITRWDGAADDFEGVHSVDWAVTQYLSNQFNRGGNRPTCSQYGNWIEPDGSGRTFYVGKRKNGKLIRIYEKGKQVGDPSSPWVRWELELHNKDRSIPWDAVLSPGTYVAGAYPCTEWIAAKACRIRTIKETLSIGYERLTEYARQSYGRHVNVMMKELGSAEKVVERLLRPGKPARLAVPLPPEFEGPPFPRKKAG